MSVRGRLGHRQRGSGQNRTIGYKGTGKTRREKGGFTTKKLNKEACSARNSSPCDPAIAPETEEMKGYIGGRGLRSDGGTKIGGI